MVRDYVEERFGPNRRLSPTDDFLDTFEPPIGMSKPEIEAHLADLDPSMGRFEWIRVGMALHHETEGEGFVLWDTWSSAGHNYPGTEALESQWVSFDRREPEGRQVTMRSVMRMSRLAREARGELPLVHRVPRAVEVGANDNPAIVATPPDYAGEYRIVSAAEFTQRPPLSWIVKSVFPRADLGVVYGPSGSGKSAFVLDLGIAIARGEWWRGNRVRKGRVLYLAAEGADGVSGRLKAYAKHHGIDLSSLPIDVLAEQPNLLDLGCVAKVARSVVAVGQFDLIIIDTLAQVMQGADENSSQDMGRALRHARAIGENTGAMVLLVHHSGKDASRGARGWSGLRAAADVEIEITQDRALRCAQITKLKDGPEGGAYAFELDPVNLGADADGDPITSIVVRYVASDDRPTGAASKPKGENQRLILKAVDALSPFPETAATIDAVIDQALDWKRAQQPQTVGKGRDQSRSNLRRTLNGLVNHHLFIDGDRVALHPFPASDEARA